MSVHIHEEAFHFALEAEDDDKEGNNGYSQNSEADQKRVE